jgi:hypothetical protein
VHDLKICWLAPPADSVAMAGVSFGKDENECSYMVLDVEPVSDILTIPIDRQVFAFERI